MDYCKNCETHLCCKSITMPVQLTLFDLYRIAKEKRMKVSELFSSKCCLLPGLLRPGAAYKIDTTFGVPCAFLKDGCDCHLSKPIACLKFPASVQSLKEYDYFDYPCSGYNLPEEKSLVELEAVHEEEDNKTRASLFFKKTPLLFIGSLPQEISLQIQNSDTKIIRQNLPQKEAHKKAIEFYQAVLTPLIRSSELTYQFWHEYGHSFDKKINLWNFCLERIKDIEQSKSFLESAEFSSRKYFKIRKKYQI
ncbi:MAG: hypothetical protein V1494_00615 [Candidatus Diapherotrites archaeon]